MSKTFDFNQVFKYIDITDLLITWDINSDLLQVKRVIVGGWEYRIDSILVVKHRFETDSELPEMVQITNIIINKNTPYAITSLFETISYERHFHSYYVKLFQPLREKVITLKQLSICEPLWLLHSFIDSKSYVCPRHWV